MKKHSVSIRGHRTSFSIEDEFWDEFQKLARAQNLSVAGLITQIDEARPEGRNLSSAIRVYVLEQLLGKD